MVISTIKIKDNISNSLGYQGNIKFNEASLNFKV